MNVCSCYLKNTLYISEKITAAKWKKIENILQSMFDEMMSSFMDSSIIRGLLDNLTIIYVLESSPQNVYAPESSTQNVSYGSVQTPNSRNRSGSLFCESFT